MNAVRIDVVELTRDRRTKAQHSSYAAIEQERADKRIEDIWRERVRQNEMRRIEKKFIPEPVFDDWRDAAAYDAGIPRHGEI